MYRFNFQNKYYVLTILIDCIKTNNAISNVGMRFVKHTILVNLLTTNKCVR